MSDGTKIEWTDATWNPITGCSRISPGCEHCYAERLAAGRLRNHPSRKGLTNERGVWNGEVRFNEQWLDQPIRWKKPRMVFVCAHADLFHEHVPTEWIDSVFAVMAMARQHVFQVLTKRPGRMRQYLSEPIGARLGDTVIERLERCIDYRYQGFLVTWPWAHTFDERWPLPNVWLGTSVENQVTVNERTLPLRLTPAAVRWMSIEPLLEPIYLLKPVIVYSPESFEPSKEYLHPLNWVVVGGESGPGYRPMDPDWARSIRDECAVAGVPFFMKQMAGKKPIPDDLKIRQFPEVG